MLLIATPACSLLVDGNADDAPDIDLSTTCGARSLQFAEGQFATLPEHLAAFGAGDFTAGIWAKPENVSGRRTLVSNHEMFSAGGLGWSMGIQDSTPTVGVFSLDDQCLAADDGGSGFSTTEWTHIAFSYTQAAGGGDAQLLLFINGREVDRQNCTSEPSPYLEKKLVLGRDARAGSGGYLGQLDDFVICAPGTLAEFAPEDLPYCRDEGARILAAFPMEPEEATSQSVDDLVDPDFSGTLGTVDRVETEDPAYVDGDECD